MHEALPRPFEVPENRYFVIFGLRGWFDSIFSAWGITISYFLCKVMDIGAEGAISKFFGAISKNLAVNR